MTQSPRPWIAAALVIASTLSARSSLADAGPKVSDSLWLPMGMNFGYSLNPDPAPNGFLVGPEVSLVYIGRDLYWFGAYTDVLRDFGTDATRLSAGLEAGMAIFGFDVGYVSEFREGEQQSGVRGRLLFSFAAVHFYGGMGQVFGEPKHSYGEIGVLLKVPIVLWEAPRRWHRPRYEPEPRPEPPEYPSPAPAPPGQPPTPEPGPSPFAEPPPGS